MVLLSVSYSQVLSFYISLKSISKSNLYVHRKHSGAAAVLRINLIHSTVESYADTFCRSSLPVDGSFSHGNVTVSDFKASRGLVQRGATAAGRTGPHS